MDATVEKREIIFFRGIDGEWFFRTTFHSMGAITVVLVEDISDGGRGSTMVPRPHEIPRYLCQHFNVQAEKLVLLRQDDLCWPAWIAWLLGYHVRRHYWIATRMPKPEDEVSEMFAWEWKPCAWREAHQHDDVFERLVGYWQQLRFGLVIEPQPAALFLEQLEIGHIPNDLPLPRLIQHSAQGAERVVSVCRRTREAYAFDHISCDSIQSHLGQLRGLQESPAVQVIASSVKFQPGSFDPFHES